MSAVTRNQVFTAVHTVGGLLPADMLVRISEGKDVPGSKPADYGLPSSRSVRDEAERSWEYLKPLWRDLRKHLPEDRETGLPAADPTGRAGSDWLAPLWRELGFGPLSHVGPSGITADSDAEKKFPVSHRWRHALIHQTAWNADLDKRLGGAGSVPPQSMLQECLNRTEAHLWGVLTNGRHVRLLRDSSALATASYVEFDLEAIFDGELFSEFVLLYRVLHVSRFEVTEDAPPSACRLEKWRTEAIASGTRALDQLRKGVQDAITALGTGFLRHPENTALRKDVHPKPLQAALLRLVYRLLFVFVAEDRDALLSPKADPQARERYEAYFSSARLRAHARKRRGTAHGDLYEALRIVLDALGDEKGRPELGLPGLGGLFNDTDADAPLRELKLSNEALLTAVRHLSQVRDGSSGRWRAVDYRHLDAEELGSVYESLLELEPKHSVSERTFTLAEMAGNTRKTTGSYYTPSSLIECLLDSTLDPVIQDSMKQGEEAASKSGAIDSTESIVNELLSLRVCDPACGSGHFLVAAARRIAKQVAAVRERNPEPTLDAVRHALHEVVALCIYGIDLNPMAVELAKVSLWLEALEPGKPLGFLDSHVKHGNALVGSTPALLRGGIPDAAFKPIEGDDKKFAKALEKINQQERVGQGSLFDIDDEAVDVANTAFASGLRSITLARSDELTDVRRQEEAYEKWSASSTYQRALRVADAWCAAFVWLKTPKAPRAVTQAVLKALEDPSEASVAPETTAEIVRLRDQYGFFHWHLEFPEVFSVPASAAGVDEITGWTGGFDAVLGNPPWERIKLLELEFFANRNAEIFMAKNASARKKLIEALKNSSDGAKLYADFGAAKRQAEGESHSLRNTGRYPLAGRGDVNTYAVFAETASNAITPHGRFGLVLPTGIATDATTAPFFSDLVRSARVASFLEFENEAFILSRDVDHRVRFALLTGTGRAQRVHKASFAFSVRYIQDLNERRFAMPPEEILLVNPNTGTLPLFRSRRDAEITLSAQARGKIFQAIGNTLPSLQTRIRRIYDLGKPAGVELCTPTAGISEKLSNLRMYEGKLFHAFDHRFASYDGAGLSVAEFSDRNPNDLIEARYYLKDQARLDSDLRDWTRPWILGFRDIARTTDERTVIATALPRVPTDYTVRVMIPTGRHPWLFLANINSFVFDYLYRLRLGGTHLSDFITYQLPAIPESTYLAHTLGHTPLVNWVTSRVLELTYTACDMRGFAADLGDTDSPFRWDEGRRRVIRAELDALYFHLYGISREDADYILDTFPIVRRKDEAKYGTYRTKELILAEYDRMAEAGLTLDNPLVDGENYTSTLTPPPGHGLRHPA
ncbi:Eco57I restriction-modification methylase domain-containing protein [Streptomyces sp. NPDC058694]|uniref:Eco57I restriction-modification methylase domain-containing protein n=1 Tax=Streptomyces sp. NPDC058694 TaxID=3346603 RepID=UPI00365E282E